MKRKIQLVLNTGIILLLVSCTKIDSGSNGGNLKSIEESQRIIISRLDAVKDLSQKLDKLENNQKDIQTAIRNLEKSIGNVSSKDKKPAKEQNKTAQNTDSKWKSDKVYTAPVGDSYYMGPANAKVTITEWGDYF